MKPIVLTILMGLCSVFGAFATSESSVNMDFANEMGPETIFEGKKFVRVTTPYQLALAIIGGRDILVPKDTVIDLTPLLYYKEWWQNRDHCKWLGANGATDITEPAIVSEEVPHGRQLCIVNCKDFSIVGEGNSHIVLDPRFAYCLRLVNCENVTLRNLDIRHTDGNPVQTGAISVVRGRGVTIDSCNLRGLFSDGLLLIKTTDFVMRNSDIHDTSGGLLDIRFVDSARFDGCRFYRNSGKPQIYTTDSDVTFTNCRFYGNDPYMPLFSGNGTVRLTGCQVMQPMATLGILDPARLADNRFCNTPGTVEPGKIKVNFKGAMPGVTDFVNALVSASGFEQMPGNSWARGWKKYLATRKSGSLDTYTIDKEAGYAGIVTKGASGSDGITFHDFRVWDCPDGRHKLVGHSRGILRDGKAVENADGGLTFYSYDIQSHNLSYICYDNYAFDGRPAISTDIVYRLLPGSPDITYIDADGQSGTLRWFGDGFGDKSIIER